MMFKNSVLFAIWTHSSLY